MKEGIPPHSPFRDTAETLSSHPGGAVLLGLAFFSFSLCLRVILFRVSLSSIMDEPKRDAPEECASLPSEFVRLLFLFPTNLLPPGESLSDSASFVCPSFRADVSLASSRSLNTVYVHLWCIPPPLFFSSFLSFSARPFFSAKLDLSCSAPEGALFFISEQLFSVCSIHPSVRLNPSRQSCFYWRPQEKRVFGGGASGYCVVLAVVN